MNQPPQHRTLGIATVAGYLITAAIIVAVAVTAITPVKRSESFWYNVALTEFLALVVWAYLGGVFQLLLPATKEPRGLAGVLPITGLIVFGYVIFSFLLMLLSEQLGQSHWTAQFVLLMGFALWFAPLNLARFGAVAGTEPIPPQIRAPQDLAAMLRIHEDMLWTPLPAAATRRLSEAIKALREKIQHSLPNVGRIGQTQEYQNFARQIEALCTDLQALPADSSDQALFVRLQAAATQLAAQTQYIASTLKTRPS